MAHKLKGKTWSASVLLHFALLLFISFCVKSYYILRYYFVARVITFCVTITFCVSNCVTIVLLLIALLLYFVA